jgi:hypothetical protein
VRREKEGRKEMSNWKDEADRTRLVKRTGAMRVQVVKQDRLHRVKSRAVWGIGAKRFIWR